MRETIKNIAEALGYAYQEDDEKWITGIAIDSRTVQPGDLFVALVGEKTDGHRYLCQAIEQGAAAVVISREEILSANDYQNYILVSDGVLFIQQLAHWQRSKVQIPVIAVTGSTGKTSTKDFLAALLESLGHVVVTKGNHNNELGLPLTICGLEKDTKAVVVEMGMRGLGQIDFLCRIAEPDYGIITNIGKSHCELLGSQENIARAKCELLPYIKEDSIIVLNKKDEVFLQPWLFSCKGKILWFDATGQHADLWADEIFQGEDTIRYQLHWGDEQQEIVLPVQGVHNVSNSLAAIGIAHSLGISWEDIRHTLQKVKLTGMRLAMTVSAQGVKIINDAYNANPDSMKSALGVLVQQKGDRKIAVLGDMYELGCYEEESHKEVGTAVAAQKIDYLIAVGALGKLIGEAAQVAGCHVDWAENNEQAITLLRQYVHADDVVLVKGSRGMQMEQIVQNMMG